MHDSSDCTVLLHTASQPIIERSSALVFGPYPTSLTVRRHPRLFAATTAATQAGASSRMPLPLSPTFCLDLADIRPQLSDNLSAALTTLHLRAPRSARL